MSVPVAGGSAVAPGDRSIRSRTRGLPGWGAVAVAVLVTAVGVAVDLAPADGELGWASFGCYALGCVLAVLAVRRRSVFTAMVQPPLVLAVVVPVATELLGGAVGGGASNRLLNLALPLVNGFPAMAITTGITVIIGIARLVVQGSRRRAPTPPRPVGITPDRASGTPVPSTDSAGDAVTQPLRVGTRAGPTNSTRNRDGRFPPSARRPADGRPNAAAPESGIERYRRQAGAEPVTAPVPSSTRPVRSGRRRREP